jgi:hypothetical protein
MDLKKTNSADGSVKLEFKSKNIPGSPLGLLAIVIPASLWIAMKVLELINPNMQGGGLFALLVLFNAVLMVGGYVLLRNIVFLRSHTFIKSSGQSIIIDGKTMPYSQFKNIGLNRKDEQAKLYMKKDGRELSITGWMDAQQAEEVVNLIRN